MGLAASPVGGHGGQLGRRRRARSRRRRGCRRPHDEGKPIRSATSMRLVEGVGEARLGDGEADLGHGPLEAFPVLGGGDGLGAGADHLHAVPGEHASLVEGDGQVEGGLAAQGR